jgi:hypothetical protein
MKMSHVYSDHPELFKEELLGMAESVGLNPRWLQKGVGVGRGYTHFDVSMSIRRDVVLSGALQITYHEMSRMVMSWRRPSSPVLHGFPGLYRAASLIAHEAGAINQCYPFHEWVSAADEILGAEGVYHKDLQRMSNWLLQLSPRDLETLCCGENMEQQALVSMYDCPEHLGLLTDLSQMESS